MKIIFPRIKPVRSSVNTSANHSVFHFYMTQLALALSCLLALSTNVMGFQDDDNEAPKTEQKEESEKSDDDEPDFLKILSLIHI